MLFMQRESCSGHWMLLGEMSSVSNPAVIWRRSVTSVLIPASKGIHQENPYPCHVDPSTHNVACLRTR